MSDEDKIQAFRKGLSEKESGVFYPGRKCEESRAAECEELEWYRDLAENANDLIQSVTPDGRFLYVNRAWCKTLGYSREDAADLSLSDIIHPDSRAHCAEVFRRVISGESVDRVEAKFVAKDGREVLVEGSANCKFVDGKPFATRGFFRDVTSQMAEYEKRKQAEMELRRSEEKYRTIFELSPEAIVLLDREGTILDANRRLYEWLMCEPEDIMGRSVSELPFLSEESKVQVLERLSQRMRGEEVPVYEVDLVSRDGEKRTGRIVGTPLRDEDRQVVQDLVMMSDITELKKMVEALHSSELRYRRTLDSLSDAIHVIDREFRFVLFNEAFRHWNEALGLETDVTGRSLFEVFPFLIETVRDEYRWVFDTGKVLVTEEITRIGDREIETETRKIPIFDGSPEEVGRPTRVATVIRDITESKQGDRALRESEEKYRTLMLASPDAVALINSETVIEYVSPRLVKLHGYSQSDELMGRNAIELVAPESREKMMVNFQRLLTEGIIRNVELTMLRKDGSRFVGELNVASIRDADGELSAFVGILRDITERKQMTKALWDSQERLRESITERRLMRSGRLASLGTLCATLIHELNNPLDGALRYMRLLIDQIPESDSCRMYAEQSCDGMMRMAKMIRGMSDFAKRSRSTLGPTDISESIEGIVSSFSDQILAQGIKVETEFGEGMSAALNRDVEDIFTNVIKNAIQAMPDGGTLSVKVRGITMSPPRSSEEDEFTDPHLRSPVEVALGYPHRFFEARFSDTGPGIPDEIMDSIFEPFFTTKAFDHGIGLGLFISRAIAESYNGSIDVESELGKGATFIVRLPVYKGRILVMDDEKYARDVTAGMLSAIGYKVTVAMDGAEAVEIYKEAMDFGQPYDAVILDLAVPGGMGAEETIKKLVEMDPEVKAIACSGYADNPIMSNFSDYGFKYAIAKPYVLEELSEVLHQALKA